MRYVDTRSGEEYEQPAGIVILGAYVFNNVLLMLTAGIGEPYDHTTGKGAVGRNYCYQVSGNGVTVFFEDKEINPFMAAGRAWHELSTTSTATISITRASASSAAPGFRRARPTAGRS